MSSLSRHNPIGRFDGRAELYARHRPDYPAAAIHCIISTAQLGPQSLLVDIGCGTGISSRQFAAAGIAVLGLEPNDQMRAQAELAAPPVGGPAPRYRTGHAEATGLPVSSADMVVAAQSFHWFEPEAALREFHRLLRPGGWVALMWNERDEADEFTHAYSALLRATPEAPLMEGVRQRGGDALLASPLFRHAHRIVFPQEQPLDEEGLLGRAFSVSYVPQEPATAAPLAGQLRGLFANHQRQGLVRLMYRTSVYLGQK
jgi:SAM-dependent methyltransferase